MRWRPKFSVRFLLGLTALAAVGLAYSEFVRRDQQMMLGLIGPSCSWLLYDRDGASHPDYLRPSNAREFTADLPWQERLHRAVVPLSSRVRELQFQGGYEFPLGDAAEPPRDQRRVADWLGDAYDPLPVVQRVGEHRGRFIDLQHCDFSHYDLTRPEEVAALSGLPDCPTLAVILSRLPTEADAEALAQLRFSSSLKRLSLDYCRGPLIPLITRTSKLDDLMVTSQDELDELFASPLAGAALASLRRLEVTTSELSEASVVAVASLPYLEEFSAHFVPVSDRGLEVLARSPRMKKLLMRHTNISAAQVARLRTEAPHVEIVEDVTNPRPMPWD